MPTATMSELRFQKKQVLEVLRKNRQEHRKVFEDAMEGYRKQVITRLEASIDEVKKGNRIEEAIRIPRPTDQTKDYDRVIKMLEMCQDDELVLDQQEFSNYIMDEWTWSQGFFASNAPYSTAAASKLK